MLTMKEVFDRFDEIGCCSFATPDGHGGVEARIAHFFGLFGGFCGRDSGIGPAQRAKTTIWN
ncbi:hypothetical protein [Gordonibacter urolithinfaciens]|uniref:hypothetical protein n=1 Tax=Gordonibacter urolithinfaciens TaxID=1335613 RepID=UPI003A8CE3C8